MNLMQRLEKAVSQDELVRWTMDMIRIPSYAGVPQQETAVALYMKALLESEGIPCDLTEVEDGRCNMTAVLKGTGGGKTLLLNGHMDTVEPNDMADALHPTVVNGNILGRGASDMKGPLASMMGALIGLKRAAITLKGDVVLTGVLDEEHNSIGTIDLIEKGLKADGAIVGEPTELQLCTAHRGLEWYEFTFTGKTVHGGSQKEGINAISKAVDFINVLDQELSPNIFARKHPLLEEATVNYGVIHGGTQLSTVAGECRLYVDRRFLPSEDYGDVEREFQDLINVLTEKDKDFHCTMKVTKESLMKKGYVHLPMEISDEHSFTKLVHRTLCTALGTPVKKTYFPAWTDGGLLSNYACIPTLVFGPGHITACHSKEEHIAIDHLVKGYLCYGMIAAQFCDL